MNAVSRIDSHSLSDTSTALPALDVMVMGAWSWLTCSIKGKSCARAVDAEMIMRAPVLRCRLAPCTSSCTRSGICVGPLIDGVCDWAI